MALSTPADREFQIRPRGTVRDKVILANFREGLRGQVNPATGALFTEDEIQRATRPKSRWYIGAQAIDDYDQGEQRKALWLNDQVRIERASDAWLLDFHGRLEGETYLDATGASGLVLARGTPGTIVRGSTTPNDTLAYTARSPAGVLYQAFTPVTIGSDGTAQVTMFALSTGKVSNVAAPSTLTWSRRDPNMTATADLVGDIQGGTDRESAAEFASRLASLRRFRPGAGNDANFRAWARSSNNSIAEGWVYPNALYAGSTLVAITEKRSGARGPLGRVPTSFVLAQAIGYLTPPSSPVVPGRARVVVAPIVPEYNDAVVRLDLQRGTRAGWTDAIPFPKFDGTTKPSIQAITSQTDFVCLCTGDATLPQQTAGATLSGALAPSIMIWSRARSLFTALPIASITDLGSNLFRIVLSGPPIDMDGNVVTLAVGDWISPNVDRSAVIAQAVADYFDELGPGEIVDQVNDVRGGRCLRFPFTDEYAYRAGSVLASRIVEALGSSTADGELAYIQKTAPSLPSLIINGPNMLVPGRFAIFEL